MDTENMISIYEIMFSTGDVIAIVVSIIAFVGVIISTIITNITSKLSRKLLARVPGTFAD